MQKKFGLTLSSISQGARGEHFFAPQEDSVRKDQEMFMLGITASLKDGVPKKALQQFVQTALQTRRTMSALGVPPFTDEFLKEVDKVFK